MNQASASCQALVAAVRQSMERAPAGGRPTMSDAGLQRQPWADLWVRICTPPFYRVQFDGKCLRLRLRRGVLGPPLISPTGGRGNFAGS